MECLRYGWFFPFCLRVRLCVCVRYHGGSLFNAVMHSVSLTWQADIITLQLQWVTAVGMHGCRRKLKGMLSLCLLSLSCLFFKGSSLLIQDSNCFIKDQLDLKTCIYSPKNLIMAHTWWPFKKLSFFRPPRTKRATSCTSAPKIWAPRVYFGVCSCS